MGIQFQPASEEDFHQLSELRIEAMRESLENVGRFDRQRSIDRFQASFVAKETTKILENNVLIGFFSFSVNSDHIFVQHLYVSPTHQSQGVGATAMSRVINVSDDMQLPIRLGALKESRSNDFYRNLGFKAISEDEWDINYERAADK